MEEVVTKAMKTVTEGIKELEKMLVELKEKQMQFEERIRQKDREFHVEMMRMCRVLASRKSNWILYVPFTITTRIF